MNNKIQFLYEQVNSIHVCLLFHLLRRFFFYHYLFIGFSEYLICCCCLSVLIFVFFLIILEGYTFASIVDSYIMYKGAKYVKDGSYNEHSYWHCVYYKRGCKSRIISKSIDGYEMMKVRNHAHNHKITQINQKDNKL